MELICRKPTYFFKRLAVFPKKLLSTTVGVKQLLAFADTGNWILITLSLYILRWYPECFGNHSGKTTQI